MIKLSSRNKAFLTILSFSLSLLVLSSESLALLQGNRIRFVSNQPIVVVYDLDESAPDSYFWVTLGKKDPVQKTIEPVDLSEMGYLSFWVKEMEHSGSQAVNFFVEIQEDTNGDKRFVFGQDVASRAPAGRFSGAEEEKQWKKIVIPFYQFRGIRHRDRLLEMGFVFEIKRGNAKGKLLIDHLLFGSHYPEGIGGSEIRMQNRVSSFKIENRVASPEMTLKRKPTSLTLTLTFVDPYLEEIRFEESGDGGKSWRRVDSFYDHRVGGVYSTEWRPEKDSKAGQEILIRAVGMNVLGGEAELAGPYRIHFN